MPSLARSQCIQATYQKNIDTATQKFGDHESVNEGKVLSWILNFTNKDLDIAAKILEHIRYYSASNIWACTVELVKILKQEFSDKRWDKVVFIPIGGPGSGSEAVTRVLKSTRKVEVGNIKYMSDLSKMSPTDMEAIVFVDDFSGTGDSLKEWWPIVEPIVLPLVGKVPFAIAVLVLNKKAREAVNTFAKRLYCVDELNESDNVISQNSAHFTAQEKKTILKYCKKTKCAREFLQGYGDCGLLVVFKHGCPNNSLPILWHSSTDWIPLFKRRGL